MAWTRERPHSFQAALGVARAILGANSLLVSRGVVETEAEQLVIAAFRGRSAQSGQIGRFGKKLKRADLFARLQDRFPDEAGDRLLLMAGMRAEGKPLQHVTGVQEFMDHEYEVGPDVLVPRQETEVLVSAALHELGPRDPRLGIEIGVGSGAVSIELCARFPRLGMFATELTEPARARARANAQRILGSAHGRLEIVRAGHALEVWEPLRAPLGARRADFVISNPPYLVPGDPIDREVEDHEPAEALFAPAADPLHFYREIALHAGRLLVPRGMVFVELAPERASDVLGLFLVGDWDAHLLKDLTGRNRVLIASFPGKG